MSNVSIQATDFTSMNPSQLFSLLEKNPGMSEAIKEYLNTFTRYTTEWDQGHVDKRKALYAMMPNIETLIFTVYGFANQVFYLRPSIKSIHLEFQLSLNEDKEYVILELFSKHAYLDWFKEIKKYILENPDSQLEELHIRFMPEVKLFMTIPQYYTAGYDEDGPIYEDEVWDVKTSKHKPAEYLFALTKKSRDEMKEIGEALLQLLKTRSWKAITLPSHFPSAATVAQLYPFTTFTDEIQEQGAKGRIVDSLQEFRREHNAVLRKKQIK